MVSAMQCKMNQSLPRGPLTSIVLGGSTLRSAAFFLGIGGSTRVNSTSGGMDNGAAPMREQRRRELENDRRGILAKAGTRKSGKRTVLKGPVTIDLLIRRRTELWWWDGKRLSMLNQEIWACMRKSSFTFAKALVSRVKDLQLGWICVSGQLIVLVHACACQAAKPKMFLPDAVGQIAAAAQQQGRACNRSSAYR